MSNPVATPSARRPITPSAKNLVWDDARRARLADCWGRGLTPFEIAAVLSDENTKITERAVQVQATRMELSARYKGDRATSINGPAKRIRCLRCTRLFASEGKHNRICSPCKDTDEWNNESPFFVISAAPGLDARKKDGS